MRLSADESHVYEGVLRVILLTLCRGYTGLCIELYTRLYAVFMLFASAKHHILIESFTLLIMPALCASYFCDECFRFCFMLALGNIFSDTR